VGVALNAVFPLVGEGLIGIMWSLHFNNTLENTKWMNTCLTIGELGTLGVQILSGAILIGSIYTIWKYLKNSRDEREQLNLKTLVLHSSAFGLFLISVVIFAFYYTLYVFSLNSPKYLKRMDHVFAANTFEIVCSFFSQCLLCVIFWLLSTPDAPKRQENTDDSSI